MLAFQLLVLVARFTKLLYFLLPFGREVEDPQAHTPYVKAVAYLIESSISNDLGKLALVLD